MAASDPIATFTRRHPTTGNPQERVAYSPSEVVQLTADGWVEKPTRAGSGGSAASGSRSASGNTSSSSS